jgi:hypothetical protein
LPIPATSKSKGLPSTASHAMPVNMSVELAVSYKEGFIPA